jgi:hypothetical protein
VGHEHPLKKSALRDRFVSEEFAKTAALKPKNLGPIFSPKNPRKKWRF